MKTLFIILILGIPLLSTAEVLSENERSKKKLVSRMYQTTEAALDICPENNLDEFRLTLDQFEGKYTELNKLLKASKYRDDAINNFADDIQRIRAETDESRLHQCLFLKSILDSMLNTAEGQNEIKAYVQLLKG